MVRDSANVGVGEFTAYPRGKHDYCQRLGILSFFAVVMIIYLYVDTRRFRMLSREEKPFRGAALARAGPVGEATRMNAELRPVAVVKEDVYGEEEEAVVLKTKLTRLEDESNTQSLAAETSPSKATTLAVPVVTQTQRPVIVSTTPALIEFELVPVTNSGRGKGGVEAGSDDVRLKTVVNTGMETTPTTSGTSKGQRTRAEDMAEIVKRLEKLEAEVASKTQTRR
ncbi:hypothetical protein Pmar_PMAR017892 [Perkinsus marinus ATCC 50983]|uniref:Uncharacterized protein n=1 Tax=Perkinsus marinus (strain ATCC 50983 / TXsc) TaxID=423536 RepID=C5L334_PERM5|nr:hypothetical protein Pmar_PMAR017892 [Perkinsus marinus ATCC 50983]EER08859.1 hypothetical protein Pmar_PMAR017892 [Perkinsus marinus ATCC 50983]|eukprot:XP_002777043.1 hypothetical protein Pmar_PMAR017892 [Perkinsus marinus ATCC 50983]